MPVYIDSEGTRYWFDTAPDPALTRADLALAPPELQDGPDAALVVTEPETPEG